MAKLRHIAMQVPNLQESAAFYEKVFGLERVSEVESPIGDAVMLSDGVMNLTLLYFPEGTVGGINGPDWAGLHHFGMIVEDKDATTAQIEKAGGTFFMELAGDYPGIEAETKFKDPNGIIFDISEHPWSTRRKD